MSQEEHEVNGVDTIVGLSGEPPREIPIPHKLLETQQMLIQSWNASYAAVLPFCFKCKVPLVYHTNPKNVLFHCPVCQRKWIKGEGWNK